MFRLFVRNAGRLRPIPPHSREMCFIPKFEIPPLIRIKDVIQTKKPKRNVTEYPRRVGLIGMKVGMIALFDNWGKRLTCTVVHIEPNHVVQTKTPKTDHYGLYSVQVGARNAKRKHVNKAQVCHFEKAGVPLKRLLREFTVSGPECIPPVGTQLLAQHFKVGQYVSVRGTTKGKGTQGVMKRWGFKGQGKSHGTSLAHRSPGSIGNIGQGKVLKGKKMAGKMGNKAKFFPSILVHKIDTEKQLLYLVGALPGFEGSTLYIRDSYFKPFISDEKEELDLPVPTYTPPEDGGEELPKIMVRHVKRNVLEEE